MSSSPLVDTIKSRHLISNAGWNIVGRIAPVFVAILTTPKLIHMLGLSRWGVFTLALSLIGTFGIFDLGLGRALSRAIATKGDRGHDPDSVDLVWTGVAVLTAIGVAGALLSFLCVDLWVRYALKIPADLHHEVRLSFFIFCATAPLVMINAALWGVVTGYHAFRAANLINIPISVTYYIGPMLMLYVWNSLVGVMLVLAACRLWQAIAYIRLARRLVPELKSARFRPRLLAPLMKYSGWLTVSNILYPLLGYIDRFIISSIISVAETSYYTTPSDAVNRLNMMTSSVNASSFPAFSSVYATNPGKACEFYKTSIVTVSAILFPACFVASLLSHDILALWIDPHFADHSARIMKILCLGVFLGGVDSISATFLEAIGRPDIGTRISIGEFVFFVPVLYVFLMQAGITGAAAAWSLRILADYLVRVALCLRVYPPLRRTFARGASVVFVGAGALGVALVPMPRSMALLAASAILALFYAVIWFVTLDADERHGFMFILNRLGGRMIRLRSS